MMQRHMIGTEAGGIAAMKSICDLLSIGIDPTSTPVVYESVGTDLNGASIEAGFGSTTWTWDLMPQSDYDYLLKLQGDLPGAPMYVRAQKYGGASGIDFADYSCMVGRPTFSERVGLVCNSVTLPITMMLEIP